LPQKNKLGQRQSNVSPKLNATDLYKYLNDIFKMGLSSSLCPY